MTPSAAGKRVIPFGGWVAAGIVFLLGFLFFSVIFIRESKATVFVKLLFPILLPMILAGYTLLIGYIYGDARRRGMRYVMWTLLAIFLSMASVSSSTSSCANRCRCTVRVAAREYNPATRSAPVAGPVSNPPARPATVPFRPAGPIAPGAETSCNISPTMGYNP